MKKTKELRDVSTTQEGKVFKQKAQLRKAKEESCCYKWCCYSKNNNDDYCDDVFWYWYWYWYFSNNDSKTNSSCDCDCNCSKCLESCCKGLFNCISNLDCDCDDD